MAAPKAPHIVETCLVKEVEAMLERFAPDYDLQAMSSHQVGSGFGAFVEALLVFKLREPVANGNGNGHHRRRPMPAMHAK
jgi:hypothetical protein